MRRRAIATALPRTRRKVNADRCLQVHGGWGYDVSVGIERYLRDARVTRLYEGTSEMQKLLVARHAVASA